MESSPAIRSSNRRPGGRTADVTKRIYQAVLDLLIAGGTQACTFKAVAERAGIERSTLYRRFPDRWEMIVDAILAKSADIVPDLGHSFKEDLTSVLHKLAAVMRTPLGPAFVAAIAELRSRSEVTPRTDFDRRMAQLEPMFEAAIQRGELPRDVDREALFTFAAGAIHFRTIIAARIVDDAFIDNVVDATCSSFCKRS